MIKVEKSTIVHRPSDEVFAFVADQTNAALWQSGIVEVRRLTDGPPGVGTRHTFTRTLMGRRMTGENEYVAFEPGKQVAFRTTSGPRLLASYAVTATPEGTRLTATMEVDFSGSCPWRSRWSPGRSAGTSSRTSLGSRPSLSRARLRLPRIRLAPVRCDSCSNAPHRGGDDHGAARRYPSRGAAWTPSSTTSWTCAV